MGDCCVYAANNVEVVPKEAYEKVKAEARLVKHQLAMIRGMHEPHLPAAVDFDCCAHCNSLNGGYIPWPCPTIQLLDGLTP